MTFPQRFGKLTAVREDPAIHHNWICQCDCGRERSVRQYSLTLGKTKSCGCSRTTYGGSIHGMRSRHGHSSGRAGQSSPEYHTWTAMRARCLNPKRQNYKYYGALGVTVHPEWITSFSAFLRDVGPKPTLGHSLDRFPNRAGNYEPGNVRWATREEQSRNRCNSRWLEVDGVNRLIVEWAEIQKISPAKIIRRLADGWLPNEAIAEADGRKTKRESRASD